MSPLFGKKRRPSTIAILDIESGSVGSGLVTLGKKKSPGLFAQERNGILPRTRREASALLKEIEGEIERAVIRLSEVSNKLQSYQGGGSIGRIAVFLHAPWSSVALGERARGDAHEATLARLKPAANVLGLPVTFHSFAATTTPIVHGLFGAPKDALVISIGGEVAELTLLKNAGIAGYATVPAGLNTLLRTLEAHGGMSRIEATSVLSLARANTSHAWAEALAAGVETLAREIRSGASDLLSQSSGARQVFVLSREPGADFLARALTEDAALNELFAAGSTVRPVLSRHMSPHLFAHPHKPDVALMLESLFVDTRFGS